MEHKCHVALDLIFLEGLPSHNSFPGGGNLDQNFGSISPLILVQLNNPFGPLDGGFFIEGQFGINFRRHVAGDNLEDFATKGNGQMVKDQVDQIAFFQVVELGPNHWFWLLLLLALSHVHLEIVDPELH